MVVGGLSLALMPPQAAGAAPTLLLLASTATDTLSVEPYCHVGCRLHAQGWNVASLDLPCHGADRRAGEPAELEGWAARASRGEDFVSAFCARARAAVEHMVDAGIADPCRLAVAGTSRGGFLALHAAAAEPRLRAVAAFAPVTELAALREFAGQGEAPLVRRLALLGAVEALAGRATWIIIGNADERVGTANAVALAGALDAARRARPDPREGVLRLMPTPGHSSCSAWHDEAAAWLSKVIQE
jgi:alpha-beta hydrolase superfamily lysophospholipase